MESREANREDAPSENPEPFTRWHPRCLEVEKRLERAKQRMIALGIPLLLTTRAAWKRETPGIGNVVPFHRAR